MSGRLFFSWRMFAAARDRDDLSFSINRNARAREKLYPVSSQRVSIEIKVLTALLFFRHQEATKGLLELQSICARKFAVQRFYSKYGIPGIIGCINGSHFKIVMPRKEEEHFYYNRKHYHSLNVQMVCDDQYRIINVNSKFGGANHVAFVWQNSELNDYVQALHQSGEMVWLLGDSGYPQRPWLMTPILDSMPESEEDRYNKKHRKARVLIENTFSRIKNRWRCLHKDRVLHYKPLKCARIILTCSVLHNLCINHSLVDSDEEDGM
ncbi:hypothetical protein ACJJTC_018550 [Scirpophaga incertulas]